MQLRLRGQRSGHGHRVNRRWQTIPAPLPSCTPSRINSSTQASGLVPLSTAGQGRVMAPAALPKPLIIPSGGRRVLGLGFGGHPGGMWAQLCSGSSSPGARGQEGGRKWAAGQQVLWCWAVRASRHFAPRVLPSAQGHHHLHSALLFPTFKVLICSITQ